MLIEIQHKLARDEIPALIAELSQIRPHGDTLAYFLDDCISTLRSYYDMKKGGG
jgi:hypothetical protein